MRICAVPCVPALARSACLLIAERVKEARFLVAEISRANRRTENGYDCPRWSVSAHLPPARNSFAKRQARQKLPGRSLAHLSIPMSFEPNVGQKDNAVQFIGRGGV